MTTEKPGEDAFAERIAQPLRTPERADDTFEARAMSAVHAAARSRSPLAPRSWWLRPRVLRVTPLATLAMAAGLVALAVTPWLLRAPRDTATQVASTDTVHVVRFMLVNPDARTVALVGEFNQWEKDATPLRPTGVEGVWTVSVPLSAGRHEYAFVVRDDRGERWVADPLSHAMRDDFDTESSIIFVGASGS